MGSAAKSCSTLPAQPIELTLRVTCATVEDLASALEGIADELRDRAEQFVGVAKIEIAECVETIN